MLVCLQRAFRTAIIRLATDLGIVLLIAAIAFWAGNYLFIAVALLLGLAIGTKTTAVSAYRLRRALDRPQILRQFGPITVTERWWRTGIISRATWRWAQLANGDRLPLDEAMHSELSLAGTLRPEEASRFARLLGGRATHQLPTVVATYTQTGRLLLEVRTPGGEPLAHHPSYDTETGEG